MAFTFTPDVQEQIRKQKKEESNIATPNLSESTGFTPDPKYLESNVSESLLRADKKRMQETGGVTSFPTESTLIRRTGEIESAIEKTFGQPSLLKQSTGIPSVTDYFSADEKMGISRGAGDLTNWFLNNIAAVVDTTLRPVGLDMETLASGKEWGWGAMNKDGKYSKYYNKALKEAEKTENVFRVGYYSPATEAAIKTVFNLYQETPELKDSSLFIKDSLEHFSGQKGIVSEREVAELTDFIRPNATIAEQVIRSVPEVYGISAATIKFLFRNSREMVKRVDDSLQELYGKNKKDINSLNATEDQLSQAVIHEANKKVRSVLSGLRMTSQTKRLYRNAQQKRWIENKSYNLLRGTSPQDRAVDYYKKRKLVAKKRRDDKVLYGREKKLTRNEILKREQLALNMAKRDRINVIPKDLITVPLTEVGAAIGANLGERLIPGDWGALIGALGGGFSSLLGFEATLKVAKQGIQFATTTFADVGQAINLLDESQIERLIITGKIPSAAKSNLTKQEREGAENFAFFIQALPEEQRARVYTQIKHLNNIKKDLIAAGIDEKLLKTTVDKATGLIPLMMAREILSQAKSKKLSLSKSLNELNDVLGKTLDSEDLLREQITEFRKVMDELANSANKAGVENDQFNTFVKSMRRFTENQKQEIISARDTIDRDIDEIMRLVNHPSVTTSSEDSARIVTLVEKVMTSDFLTREGAEAGLRELKDEKVLDFGAQAKQLVEKVEEGDDVAEARLLELLGKYYDPATYQFNAEKSAHEFARTAQHWQKVWSGRGGAKFNKLPKDLEFDVTDWFVSLYSRDSSETYSKIISQSYIGKLKLQLSRTGTPNAAVVEELAERSAILNAEEVIQNNPTFRKSLYDEIQDVDPESLIINRATGETLESSDKLTYNIVRNFFIKNTKKSDGDSEVTNFDIFLMLREFAKKTGVEDSLTIKMSPMDIQKLSSGFSKLSARFYKDKDTSEIAMKLGNMAKSLVEDFKYDDIGVEDAVKNQIKDAKEYWLNNVVMRYSSPKLNPIGYDLVTKVGGKPVKDPVKWINPKELFEGSSQEGSDIIEQINRTFGEFDKETEKYIIRDPFTKDQVRHLLHDLLARHIGERKEIRSAGKLTDKFDVGKEPREARLSAADDLREGTAQARQQVVPEILSSPSMDILERSGLIDREFLINHNLSVTEYLGGTARLKRAESLTTAAVADSRKRNDKLFNQREKALTAAIDYTSLGGADIRVDNYDGFLDFFVTSPQAITRIDSVASDISKSLGVSVGEAKDLFSDITIEAIARSSRGGQLESLEQPGELIKNFDHNKFHSLVVEHEDILRKILGGNSNTDERYTSMRSMAEFLFIQNRSASDTLLPKGVSLTVPKGLSVESLLSRTYSIARGVISPKYVMTEVALLGLRKKKAESLSTILQNPEITDAVIDIIESGGSEIRKYNKDLLVTLVNGLAYAEHTRKKQDRDEQMKSLERRRLQ